MENDDLPKIPAFLEDYDIYSVIRSVFPDTPPPYNESVIASYDPESTRSDLTVSPVETESDISAAASSTKASGKGRTLLAIEFELVQVIPGSHMEATKDADFVFSWAQLAIKTGWGVGGLRRRLPGEGSTSRIASRRGAEVEWDVTRLKFTRTVRDAEKQCPVEEKLYKRVPFSVRIRIGTPTETTWELVQGFAVLLKRLGPPMTMTMLKRHLGSESDEYCFYHLIHGRCVVKRLESK